MTKLRAILRRRWPILAVALVLGLLAGYASTAVGPERDVTYFQADQVILANRIAGNPANVAQDALKVTRGQVPVVAAEKLGEPENAAALARDLEVKDDTDSNSISLRVYDTDPDRASEVVQAFATAYIEVVNAELRSEDTRQLEQLTERLTLADQELVLFDEQNGWITRPDISRPVTQTVDALVAERQRLYQRTVDARTRLEAAQLETSQREPYTTLGPEKPRVSDSQMIEVPSSPLFRMGLLGLIGLMLGVALVLLVERINQRVDTREELASLVSVPIIAEIGRVPARRRPGHGDGRIKLDGIWSEHYRRVRSAIQFVQADAAAQEDVRRSSPGASGAVISGHRAQSGAIPRIFLFASALPGEGKSTSTALTAMALAETGDETLVINADFRRPMVEKYLGARSSPSLADRAELDVNRADLEDVVQSTDEDHLWVAAGGPPTTEVGGRLVAAKELAAEAASQGATVLIDSSPLRVSNEPIDLLASVDEVILVVRAGRTTVKSLEDTMELLEMHHAPVLGIVLIGTLSTREMYAYYQSYYYTAKPQPDAEADAGGGTDGDDDIGDAGDVDGDIVEQRGSRLLTSSSLSTRRGRLA